MPYAAQHKKYDATGLATASPHATAPTKPHALRGACMYEKHTCTTAPTATAGLAHSMDEVSSRGYMLTQYT